MIAAPGELGVDCDQILHPAHLAGEHDAIPWQPLSLGRLGAGDGRHHQRFPGHQVGIQWEPELIAVDEGASLGASGVSATDERALIRKSLELILSSADT